MTCFAQADVAGLLACTDGYWKFLPRVALEVALRSLVAGGPATDIVDELDRQLVLAHSGFPDDATILLARLEPGNAGSA